MYVCLCVYISLNHFAIQQKLIQHCKSIILQLKKKTERASPIQEDVPPNQGTFSTAYGQVRVRRQPPCPSPKYKPGGQVLGMLNSGQMGVDRGSDHLAGPGQHGGCGENDRAGHHLPQYTNAPHAPQDPLYTPPHSQLTPADPHHSNAPSNKHWYHQYTLTSIPTDTPTPQRHTHTPKDTLTSLRYIQFLHKPTHTQQTPCRHTHNPQETYEDTYTTHTLPTETLST